MTIPCRRFLLTPLLAISPWLAAQPFPEGLAPVELLQEFAGGMALPGLPADFPVPPLPEDHGIRVIGSLDQGSVHQVVLHTPSPAVQSLEQLREAYTGNGWIDMAPDSPASSTVALCHGFYGNLQLSLSAAGDRLRARHSNIPSGVVGLYRDCEQEREQRRASALMLQLLTGELMPDLPPPEGAVPQPPRQPDFPDLGIRGIAIGGSQTGLVNTEIHWQTQLTVAELDVADLYQHYAGQLRDQGWDEDSAGIGGLSATAVWLRTVDTPEAMTGGPEQLTLRGTFTIQQHGDDAYMLWLRVNTSLPGPGASIGGGWLPIFVDRPVSFTDELPIFQP